MKVRAACAVRDADDIRQLLDALDVRSNFPDEPLSPRSRHLIEELLAE